MSDRPALVLATCLAALGLVVGNALVRAIVRLTEDLRPAPEPHAPNHWTLYVPLVGFFAAGGRRRYRGHSLGGWSLLVELGTATLFAGLYLAMTEFRCQHTPEVQPGEFWRAARVAYQLVLVTLLLAATGTDFREYVIPDRITLAGVVIGVGGAALSGELQVVHLWVDWNQEIPGIRGPHIPAWIAAQPHLHGLAWSLAGLACGAGITWLARALSSLILGQEALGFGDVTLMAMIGSFLGWQPTLFVFLLAPLCGIVVGLAVRLLSGRTFVPYGPYLAAAALLVLFGWRTIWMFEIPEVFSMRRFFGDPVALAIVAAIATAAFVVLLTLLRIYRRIPVDRRRRDESAPSPPTV